MELILKLRDLPDNTTAADIAVLHGELLKVETAIEMRIPAITTNALNAVQGPVRPVYSVPEMQSVSQVVSPRSWTGAWIAAVQRAERTHPSHSTQACSSEEGSDSESTPRQRSGPHSRGPSQIPVSVPLERPFVLPAGEWQTVVETPRQGLEVSLYDLTVDGEINGCRGRVRGTTRGSSRVMVELIRAEPYRAYSRRPGACLAPVRVVNVQLSNLCQRVKGAEGTEAPSDATVMEAEVNVYRVAGSSSASSWITTPSPGSALALLRVELPERQRGDTRCHSMFNQPKWQESLRQSLCTTVAEGLLGVSFEESSCAATIRGKVSESYVSRAAPWPEGSKLPVFTGDPLAVGSAFAVVLCIEGCDMAKDISFNTEISRASDELREKAEQRATAELNARQRVKEAEELALSITNSEIAERTQRTAASIRRESARSLRCSPQVGFDPGRDRREHELNQDSSDSEGPTEEREPALVKVALAPVIGDVGSIRPPLTPAQREAHAGTALPPPEWLTGARNLRDQDVAHPLLYKDRDPGVSDSEERDVNGLILASPSDLEQHPFQMLGICTGSQAKQRVARGEGRYSLRLGPECFIVSDASRHMWAAANEPPPGFTPNAVLTRVDVNVGALFPQETRVSRRDGMRSREAPPRQEAWMQLVVLHQVAELGPGGAIWIDYGDSFVRCYARNGRDHASPQRLLPNPEEEQIREHLKEWSTPARPLSLEQVALAFGVPLDEEADDLFKQVHRRSPPLSAHRQSPSLTAEAPEVNITPSISSPEASLYIDSAGNSHTSRILLCNGGDVYCSSSDFDVLGGLQNAEDKDLASTLIRNSTELMNTLPQDFWAQLRDLLARDPMGCMTNVPQEGRPNTVVHAWAMPVSDLLRPLLRSKLLDNPGSRDAPICNAGWHSRDTFLNTTSLPGGLSTQYRVVCTRALAWMDALDDPLDPWSVSAGALAPVALEREHILPRQEDPCSSAPYSSTERATREQEGARFSGESGMPRENSCASARSRFDEEMRSRTNPNESRQEWRQYLRVTSIHEARERAQARETALTLAPVAAHADLVEETAYSAFSASVDSAPSNAPAGGHFSPCIYTDFAYRIAPREPGGHTRLTKIHNVLCDSGASISVVDTVQAGKMLRKGADVVQYKHSRVMETRLAGGGVMAMEGEIVMEFQLKDIHNGQWYTFKEVFYVTQGVNTFILGNTFHHDSRMSLDMQHGMVSHTNQKGEVVVTGITDSYVGNVIGLVHAPVDPLVFTKVSTLIPKWSALTVQVQLPESTVGDVLITRLGQDEKSSYVLQRGLLVSECIATPEEGRVTIFIVNPTMQDIHLPASSPVGRYCLNPELLHREPDMTVDQVIDALNIPGVSEEELIKRRQDVKEMLAQGRRADYFSATRTGRCLVGECDVEFPTVWDGSKAPPNEPARPLDREQHAIARKEFDKMASNGVIVPSSSPWGAPLMMVKKPGGGWRAAVDYRRANALAVKQHYPLPLIGTTLDRIGRSKFFSSIDALTAFWQVPCSKRMQPTTAVNFPWGKWEFTTMPMGIQAGSATYQRIMDLLTNDLDFCVTFIDDVLVHSETWEQHLLDVAVVLDRIGGAGFTLKPSKCTIGEPSCVFLGHLIDAQGIRPDPSKVAEIRDAAFPSKVEDLHHWVGLCGYYSQFVPQFALIAESLNRRIHQGKSRVPAFAALAAFEHVKYILTDEGGPILVRPDFTKNFMLACDAATSRGLGAVLAQLDDEGRERPVAYWSVRFNKSEGNWSPVEHECFAFRKSVEHFNNYLSGACFDIYTDSEPLKWLQSLKRPKGKLANWIMELQSTDMIIHHRPGRLNRASDALSRLALGEAISPFDEPRAFPGDSEDLWQGPAPQVAVVQLQVAKGSSKKCMWGRKRLACLVSDGSKVLTVRNFCHDLCLPSTQKINRQEPLHLAAARALSIALCEGRAQPLTALSALTSVHKHILCGTETRYLIIICSEQQLRDVTGLHPAGEWLALHSLSASALATTDDRQAIRRLQEFSKSFHSGAMAKHRVHESLWAAFCGGADGALCLPDGRLQPTEMLLDRSAVEALRRLSIYLQGQLAMGGESPLLVVDLEYDISSSGVDLIQVAAGPFIFVFDSLTDENVLRHSEMGGVPSLRSWLEDPGCLISMQACVNDCTVLRRDFGIEVTSCFDTAIADGILRGVHYSQGRSLGTLCAHWLGSTVMQHKDDMVFRPRMFKPRPLSLKLFDYAWQDVGDGPGLYTVMSAALRRDQRCVVDEVSRQRTEAHNGLTPYKLLLLIADSNSFIAPLGQPLLILRPEDMAPFDSVVDGAQPQKILRAYSRDRLIECGCSGQAVKAALLRMGSPRRVGEVLCFTAVVPSLTDVFDRLFLLRSSIPLNAAFDSTLRPQNASLGDSVWRCVAWGIFFFRLRPAKVPAAQREALKDVAVAAAQHTPLLKNSATIEEPVTSADKRASYSPSDEEYAATLSRWTTHALEDLQRERRVAQIGGVAKPVAPLKASPKLLPLSPQLDNIPREQIAGVTVLVHDGQSVLSLVRQPATLTARQDASTRSLPYLRLMGEQTAVRGIHAARHALHMLFGPCGLSLMMGEASRGLQLQGMLKLGCTEYYEVYSVKVPRLDPGDGTLACIFQMRSCTPTAQMLFPSYSVEPLGSFLSKCNLMDRAVLGLLTPLASETALTSTPTKVVTPGTTQVYRNALSFCDSRRPQSPPAVSDTVSDLFVPQLAPIAPPHVPAMPAQEDVSSCGTARRRGQRAQPGEQPSAVDQPAAQNAVLKPGNRFPKVPNPMAMLADVLFEGNALLDVEGLGEAQKEDPFCQAVDAYFVTQTWQGTAKIPHGWASRAKEFQFIEGVLYHESEAASTGRATLQVVLPQMKAKSLITMCHDRLGHMGWKRTYEALKSKVWFRDMEKQVKSFCKGCPTCAFNKLQPHKGRMHSPANGNHPWEVLQVDIVHLHLTASGMEKAVIFYDRFSRDVEAFAVPGDVDTTQILNLIIYEIVPRHGWPRVLLSDRGSNLISKLAKEFYEAFGIDLRPGDAHMHTVVAGCERFNATLRELARACHFDSNYHWDAVLPLLIFHYKCTLQSTTGYSPFYLNHGREPELAWDAGLQGSTGSAEPSAYVRDYLLQVHLAWQITKNALTRAEIQRDFLHNRRYQAQTFVRGQRVLILQAGRKTKMHMPYVGPFLVTDVLSRDRYRLKGRQGALHLHHDFHTSRLKLYPESHVAEEVSDEDYFYVDHIVNRRREADGSFLYLVSWVGYEAAKHDTWEPIENMNAAAMDEVDYYNFEHPLPSPDDQTTERSGTSIANPVDAGSSSESEEGTDRPPSSVISSDSPAEDVGPSPLELDRQARADRLQRRTARLAAEEVRDQTADLDSTQQGSAVEASDDSTLLGDGLVTEVAPTARERDIQSRDARWEQRANRGVAATTFNNTRADIN